MRKIGRTHKRLRRLRFILTILVVSWWVSILGVPWTAYQELALFHEKKASSCRAFAESPIIEHQIEYALGTDRVCRRIERHLSAAEIAEAKCARERASYVATYHDDLRRKYSRAAWFPWLPVEPDPPPPEFPWFLVDSEP
jgi:hypothetical protein